MVCTHREMRLVSSWWAVLRRRKRGRVSSNFVGFGEEAFCSLVCGFLKCGFWHAKVGMLAQVVGNMLAAKLLVFS